MINIPDNADKETVASYKRYNNKLVETLSAIGVEIDRVSVMRYNSLKAQGITTDEILNNPERFFKC